jgi:sialic acid synthase SpsE
LIFKELKEITKEAEIDFLASPFGIKSANLLKEIGVEAYKIASPELNHLPLLEHIGILINL